LEKLRNDDQDIKVLKMKQFLPGMDAPTAALDIVLDALEVNTSVQSLYIQVSSTGFTALMVKIPLPNFVFPIKELQRGNERCTSPSFAENS